MDIMLFGRECRSCVSRDDMAVHDSDQTRVENDVVQLTTKRWEASMTVGCESAHHAMGNLILQKRAIFLYIGRALC